VRALTKSQTSSAAVLAMPRLHGAANDCSTRTRTVGRLGLAPILIKGSGNYDYDAESEQTVCDSSFIDFGELLKRLKIGVVQVEVFFFGQSDLTAEFNDREDGNDGSDEPLEKNLTSYDQSLNEFSSVPTFFRGARAVEAQFPALNPLMVA
jgi:hypothetical protein